MTFSLVGSIVALVTNVLTAVGIPGLLALMVVSCFGLPPIPSEVILPFAGFLVVDGTFSFGWALVAALVGTVLGSYAAYAVGLWWRDRITGVGVGHLRLEPKRLAQVDAFFARRGEVTVALFRLVPVVRSYISYPAGTARMEPMRFGLYTLLGSIPYTAALIYAGMVLRSNWGLVTSYFQVLDLVLLALVALVAIYFLLQVVGFLEPGWPPRRARPASVGNPTVPPPSGGVPPGG